MLSIKGLKGVEGTYNFEPKREGAEEEQERLGVRCQEHRGTRLYFDRHRRWADPYEPDSWHLVRPGKRVDNSEPKREGWRTPL